MIIEDKVVPGDTIFCIGCVLGRIMRLKSWVPNSTVNLRLQIFGVNDRKDLHYLFQYETNYKILKHHVVLSFQREMSNISRPPGG